MKKCDQCEGMGSVPDTFEPTTERERLEKQEVRSFLGAALAIIVTGALLIGHCAGMEERQLLACRAMCGERPARWDSGHRPGLRDVPPSCVCVDAP